MAARKNDNDLETLIKSLFQALTSMYTVFSQKKPINLKNINLYSSSNGVPQQEISSREIIYLYNFFYQKLNFQSETDFPIFTQDNNYEYN